MNKKYYFKIYYQIIYFHFQSPFNYIQLKSKPYLNIYTINSRLLIPQMSLTFSLEGNIGCGKTTLLRILQKEFPCISIINQPVNEWSGVAQGKVNLLDMYYKDPQRWGLTFQNFALLTRVRKWRESQDQETGKIRVSERSLEADKHIFASAMKDENYLSEDEYNIYLDYFSSYLKMFEIKPLKGFIYLRCPPETCDERIKKRRREGEGEIPLEYLKLLHRKHEEWLADQENVLILDTGIDFEEDVAEKTKIIKKIYDYLGLYN